MAPALHDDVAPLGFLIGTWRGEGRGGYPTIEPFSYREELTFEHVGEPYLLYRQESWGLEDGAPLHFERGFLRPGDGDGSLELCLAHPLGLTEVAHGSFAGRSLTLTAVAAGIGHTTTGMDVQSLARRYLVEDDVLRYELDMEMGATPMTRHLDATLRRVS
ncbi:MAG TPA: FABP family protein [Actinomycetota bacterium]|nr:FABP family protein [Actinomycetota bacterium]